MFKKIIYLLALMMICSSVGAQASEKEASLIFICHKGLHYSRTEVMYAFKAYLDEPRPVDNRPLFSAMLKVIHYSPQRYQKIWDKMYYRRALFIPKMMDDDAGVIAWVASNYAGIGYVSAVPKNNPKVEVCGNF